jgi:hypothetical protein
MRPYFGVEDDFAMDPKVVTAGNAAVGAWMRMGAHCVRHGMNGFISEKEAKLFATSSQLKKLSGLIEPAEHNGVKGYRFLDWTQPDIAVARKIRDVRAAAGRKGGQASAAARYSLDQLVPPASPPKPPKAQTLTEMLRSSQEWRPAPPKPPSPPAWPKLKAKPTMYAGIEFRSRLEARWACFFDQLDWQWTYEPFDGNHYIPDFLIHDFPVIVEVKPASELAEYQAAVPKMVKGLAGHWTGDFLILGVDPFPVGEREPYVGLWAFHDHVETPSHRLPRLLENEGWDFDPIQWPQDQVHRVRAAWAEACNVTKWRPR